MDATKWSAKWRNWNISDIFFLFEFNRGEKAAEATIIYCAIYGDSAIGGSTAGKLFSRFKEDRFDISDTPRSGKLSGFDEDCLNTLIHNDPRQCTRELANVMNCDHSTIVKHLHSIGKVKKSGVWLPHALNLSKTTKIRRWRYVHFCLLVIDWLVNNTDHSYPYRYW